MQNLGAIFSDEVVCRQIVETSPVGIVVVDDKGCIRMVNQTARKMFGYELDELLGRSIDVVAPISSRIQEVIHGPSIGEQRLGFSLPRVELHGKKKDGSVVTIDIELVPIDSRYGRLVLASIVEATDRQSIETSTINRETLDRLVLIGQLSGGIAHEIRTPLSVIRNDIYFLQSQADRLGPEANEAIQEINASLGKAIRIVTELLDFAREPACRQASTKVVSLLSTSLKSFPLPPGVQLAIDNSVENLAVRADPEQIERIIVNLLSNAVQAIHEQGKIEIKGSADQDRVSVDFIDSGPGIAEQNRRRVFDPLFTTKASGVGLGLAISHRYAERNHGRLEVVAVPSGGACLRLTLPRAPLPIEHHHE